MRRWTLLSLVVAFGCASAQTATDPPSFAPEAGATDDAWFGGGLAPGVVIPGGDDGGANPADASSGAPPGQPLYDPVDASADGPPADPDATDEPLAPPYPVLPFDPGEGGICAGGPAPGDIVIVELMIESVAGAGDHGEWLEVQSTIGCALDLRGLRGDVPSGSKVRSFDVGADLWIPAFGTFVVADSSSAAINHGLPGTVVVWSGQPGDVLRNKGDTVTLRSGGTIIDSVTYPSIAPTIGASLAFPSDCAPSRRSDWTAWQPSTFSWFPGFYGTPNAPNDDVHCP
jgi:hypothetical protein